jgi:hypothetical protein
VGLAVAVALGVDLGLSLELPFVTDGNILGLPEIGSFVEEVNGGEIGIGVITGGTVGLNTVVTLGVTLLLSGDAFVTRCLMSASFLTLVVLCTPVATRKYQRAKAANTRTTRTIQTQVRANIRIDV